MNEEKVLDLLSKLFTERDIEPTLSTALFDKLYEQVNKSFPATLNDTEYTAKSQIFMELNEVIDQIELLIKLPELIGKTVVGIIGTDKEKYFDIIDCLTDRQTALFANNHNLPEIIYYSDTDDMSRVINLLDNTVYLNDDEFINTNKEIHKHKIDVRRFLNAFAVPQKTKWRNITFVNLPLYSLKAKPYYKNLLDTLDAVIISVDGKRKWFEDLEAIKQQRNRVSVFLVNDENDSDISGICPNTYVEIGSVKALENWMDNFDQPRNNIIFVSRILRICNRVNSQLNKEKEKLEEIFAEINKNILNMDDEDTMVIIKQLKDEISKALHDNQKGLFEFKKIVDEIIETVIQLEKELSSFFNDEVPELYHGNYDSFIYWLCFELIEAHEFSRSKEYIRFLTERGYERTYLLNLYVYAERSIKIPIKYIELLKREKANDITVMRAKIKFWKQLGLDESEVYSMITSYEEIKDLTAQESELLGDYYSASALNKAIKYYQSALQMGSRSAGGKLLKIPLYRTEKNIYYLATALDPEATYIYGSSNMAEHNYFEGLKYLKISSALNNTKAIRYLADNYCKLAWISFSRDQDDYEKLADNAISLYCYLESIHETDEELYYNLGKLYHLFEEYIRAFDCFRQCKSADAIYMIGRMYQYGNGVAQDLEEAKKKFSESSRLGNGKARIEYEKVCGWIESNKARSTVRNTYDNSSHTTSRRTGTTRGCFITTATCVALGKGQDCVELEAFYSYRDNHLIDDDDGPGLIREYYRIAPIIVDLINECTNSEDIYRALYTDYISVGYFYLKNNDLRKAKQTYIKMVTELCKIFSLTN